MAKRNRKNGHEGNRLMAWGIALCSLAAVLAMVYLGLYNTCESICRRIKDLESERADLRKRVVNEEHNWATARSIRNMQRLLAAHGIAMAFPDQKNVIHMRPVEPAEPAQYAFLNSPPPRGD